MSNSTFETVYRISIFDQSEILWLLAFGVVMVFLCIRGVRRLRMASGERKGWRRWVIDWPPWFEVACGVVGLLLCSVILTLSAIRTASALHVYWGQTYNVSEGMVTVLHEQAREGHDEGDIIRVGNDQFEINYFRYTPGYKRTIARGGVLRQGVYARVFHYKGTVLRIDICRG
jgi:hypothetical protein